MSHWMPPYFFNFSYNVIMAEAQTNVTFRSLRDILKSHIGFQFDAYNELFTFNHKRTYKIYVKHYLFIRQQLLTWQQYKPLQF
jgi:hypothetical protein